MTHDDLQTIAIILIALLVVALMSRFVDDGLALYDRLTHKKPADQPPQPAETPEEERDRDHLSW